MSPDGRAPGPHVASDPLPLVFRVACHPVAKRNFTALVRDLVQEVLPTYRLIESVVGSAPELIFLRPDSGDRPRLRERVWFSKLRWGIPEFDVGMDLEYLGPAVGAEPRAYKAAPLGAEQLRGLPVDDKVAETLRRELPNIDRHASDVFSRYYSRYPKMEALGNALPRLYLAWRGELPPELKDAPAMIASAPELQGVDEETAAVRQHELFPYPARALQERRLAHFRNWLVAQGQLSSADDPAGQWLFGFWYTGRPRTPEEFKIDKHVGDECAVCRDARTRGCLVDKVDPVFGSHCEFVCSKCATN